MHEIVTEPSSLRLSLLHMLVSHDHFSSHQQAFSVFFVCVAFTSDIICLLFIPVQWLFFAASTYVWVQYVWHTGTALLCLDVLISLSSNTACGDWQTAAIKLTNGLQAAVPSIRNKSYLMTTSFVSTEVLFNKANKREGKQKKTTKGFQFIYHR